MTISRANFKTSPFAKFLRQAQILILEILNVFLWLKFLPSLIWNKIVHFETASLRKRMWKQAEGIPFARSP
jgi:hypothetical protein